MDALIDVLDTLELKGWLSSRRELVSPWRYDFAQSNDSVFHVIGGGGAFLECEGDAAPQRLDDGDVVLFPTGWPHALYDAPASALTRRVQLDYHPQRRHEVVTSDAAGKLLMLCGAFHFVYPNNSPLLQALPRCIHISGVQGRLDQRFSDLVRLLASESAVQQPGAEVVLRRLTELLFIQVIRLWSMQQGEAATWHGVLRDQPISAALGLIHETPQRKWTVSELAETVALSRSAFAARFAELVGEPPMAYLTRWRMVQATRLLKHEVKMERIAEQLGYESEAAFRKAFKREVGMPPAQYRRMG